jgi:2-iminobutanoate/2-iminopropanoate deaminase
MKFIRPNNTPVSGPYNPGILVDPDKTDLLFISGQLGKDPVTGAVVAGTELEQTAQALANLLIIVQAAGGDAHSFAKMEIFIKDAGTPEARGESRKKVNEAYAAFFEKNSVMKNEFPARTMLWVSEVPLEAPIENTLVEISAIAAIAKK